MKVLRSVIMTCTVMFLLSATSCEKDKYPELGEGVFAEIVTNKGTMVAKLTPEKTPVTVANFVALAEGDHPMVVPKFKGKPFYNGLIFHRVMNNFMIQGGCPEGTGRGTPGYRFGDEFDDDLRHDKPGILSMANPGPHANGSQFFITEKPTPWLDEKHAVFGELVLGLDIQDSISNVEVAPGDKPVEQVVIQEVNILRQGFDARKFDAVKTWETEFPKMDERAKRRAEEMAEMVRRLGGNPYVASTVKLQFEEATEDAKHLATAILNGLDIAVFYTGVGVRAIFNSAEELNALDSFRKQL